MTTDKNQQLAEKLWLQDMPESNESTINLTPANLWQFANGFKQLTKFVKEQLLRDPKANRTFRYFREQAVQIRFEQQAAADSLDYHSLNEQDGIPDFIDLPIRRAQGGIMITPIHSTADSDRLILVISSPEPLSLRLIEIIQPALNQIHERPLSNNPQEAIELHLDKFADKDFILAYADPQSTLNLI